MKIWHPNFNKARRAHLLVLSLPKAENLSSFFLTLIVLKDRTEGRQLAMDIAIYLLPSVYCCGHSFKCQAWSYLCHRYKIAFVEFISRSHTIYECSFFITTI